MRTWWTTALLLAVALSGCVSDDTAPDTTEVENVFEDTESFQEVKLGPHSGLPSERPADHTPSLDTAPQWVLGEWWTVEITDRFVGKTTTVTRVVAGKEGPDYLVGMPLEDFQDEVMILHHPGFGLVKSDTLGFETHDWLFEPLRFPLVVGDSWVSLWESETAEIEHTVLSVDDATGKAELGVRGAQPINITYDAELGAIESFDAPGYMEYHVVDHGFGYEGTVRVPHSHDLIFIHGQIGPAPVPTSATPVQQTITVPDLYDRTSFALIVFELAALLGPEPVASTSTVAGNGLYQITATAPDGAEFTAQKLPTEGGHKIEGFSHGVVAGDWTLTTVAGGPAQVFMEGIGYLTFDVSLPDGCVVVTERVHDHGGDCGGHAHDVE